MKFIYFNLQLVPIGACFVVCTGLVASATLYNFNKPDILYACCILYRIILLQLSRSSC